MAFVNGFLLAVPTVNKQKYVEVAGEAALIFKANGATAVVENWGVDVPDGEVTSFPMAVKLKEDETVVFSWITWPDKDTCDKGMAAAMTEFEARGFMKSMPFDGSRMMWGSFETIVEQ